MFNIEVHPSARDELREAAIWYNKQREGLGIEFFEEVSHNINLISENPNIWPEYLEQFHRLILKQFPYNIIYRVHHDFIEIIAIAHQKRKPLYWKNRV